jgi:hypothetical protein
MGTTCDRCMQAFRHIRNGNNIAKRAHRSYKRTRAHTRTTHNTHARVRALTHKHARTRARAPPLPPTHTQVAAALGLDVVMVAPGGLGNSFDLLRSRHEPNFHLGQTGQAPIEMVKLSEGIEVVKLVQHQPLHAAAPRGAAQGRRPQQGARPPPLF